MGQPRHFACYVEFTRQGTSADRERWQYLLFTNWHEPNVKLTHRTAAIWTRHQLRIGHRTRWANQQRVLDKRLKDSAWSWIADEIDRYGRWNAMRPQTVSLPTLWEASPVVVVEVETEYLKSLCRSASANTPYKILDKVDAKCKKVHGFTIKG
jgi:hypothetical protein